MHVSPFAKVNLGLHVMSLRKDGYHNVETCYYPIPLTDRLEIKKAKTFSLVVSGLPIDISKRKNICEEAYDLMAKEGAEPVKITLEKNIPTGAGLGGGSSDAAFTLKGLNELFELNLSKEKLIKHAQALGADCTFFLNPFPQYGFARGDELEPASLSLAGYTMVLVKPPVSISTLDAYHEIKPKSPIEPLKSVLQRPIHEWKEYLKNDFEDIIFKQYFSIEEIKTKLYKQGAIFASLSGTGSAVYGIFEKPLTESLSFNGCQTWSFVLN